MRLIGYSAGKQTWIGAFAPDGRLRPVAEIADFYSDPTGQLNAALQRQSGFLDPAEIEEAPAIMPSARIFCVGLNYHAHAAEGGNAVAPFPTLFGRWAVSLVADGAPVPAVDEKLDWEGELAVIVGRPLFQVGEQAALEGVFAYAAFNDISARTYQRHTTQWTLGKNGEKSGPISGLTTADEVGDPARGLSLTTRLNGQIVQQSSTANMIYSVGKVLSYISEILTLNPGDVIAMGTPEGVGHARNPPLFMKPGDEIEVEIERVGKVTNSIVAVSN